MYEFWFSIPFWLRTFILIFGSQMLFISIIKNIFERCAYIMASIEMLLYIFMMTGLINALVSAGFKLL